MKPAEIKDNHGIKIGVSSAASWAWGTSLVLGMEIAKQLGMKEEEVFRLSDISRDEFLDMLAAEEYSMAKIMKVI